jgi:potassium-transporting ATPase KdpC subunit
MKAYILPALRLLFVMTVFTGIAYPITMTLLSFAMFPHQARGSLIEKNGTIIGSELIGQEFVSDKYFYPRPSGIGYNPMPSCGTNWGPTDKRMADSAKARAARFTERNSLLRGTVVPKEMLFASGSGVDPHISPTAAKMQVNRIAQARRLNADEILSLNKLVEYFTEGPQFGILGESRVNVLKLNLALDRDLPSVINRNITHAFSRPRNN